MTPASVDSGVQLAIEKGFEPVRFRRGRLSIEARGEGLWAVLEDGSFCLNRDGEFEYEPMPSSRDDAFLKRCRFTLCEAVAAADKAAQAVG